MEKLIESFWRKLEGILQSFALRLLAGQSGFKHLIGRSSNSAFPLRAYLTFLRSDDGDEVSITIDVKNQGDGILIESDVVGEDGQIIVDGPSLELLGDLTGPLVQEKIDKWFEEFEKVFSDKSGDIKVEITRLNRLFD